MSNMILTPDRIHGTLVPTPSGPTLLSHYTIAWLVKTLVERSGGTFVIIIDDILAMFALASAREPVGKRAPDDLRPSVEYWTDELLGCLNHYGLGPSSEAELRAQGFNWSFPEDRQMGVKFQSDNTLTQHYYEIFGFERDFGTWPTSFSDGQVTNQESLYLSTTSGKGIRNSQVNISHPWIVLSWAVDEMSTGRNVAIDGEDLSSIIGQFGEHAQRLSIATGWTVPDHYTIPTISGRALNGNVLPLSSSNSLDIQDQNKNCPQIRISDAIEAGVDREGLDAYMFEHIIRADRLPGVTPGDLYREVLRGDSFAPPTFTDAVRSDVIIDEADWRRFLKSGELKPPKKRSGKR